jgi:glycosyltransferase involved in cell wall biosynthesis
VHLQGFLDRAAAARLFDWADFILLPSRLESIPIIFSDAMQARRPIIATPVGDLPRLLASYGTGILAQAVTPAAFVEAIREAVHHKSIALHKGAERAAANFDVHQSAHRLAALLTRRSES